MLMHSVFKFCHIFKIKNNTLKISVVALGLRHLPKSKPDYVFYTLNI